MPVISGYELLIVFNDELLRQENEPMACVITDAISVVRLHSPKKPKVVRTPHGAMTVCSTCSTLVRHSEWRY